MKWYAPEESSRLAIGRWLWPRLLWVALQNNKSNWTVTDEGIFVLFPMFERSKSNQICNIVL